MNTKMKFSKIAGVPVVTLALAASMPACGGGSGDAKPETSSPSSTASETTLSATGDTAASSNGEGLAGSVAAALTDSQTFTGISPEDATCLADRIVSDLGTQRVQELRLDEVAGVNTLAMPPATEAEAQDIVDALTGCIDVRAFIIDNSGADSARAECLIGKFSDTELKALMMPAMFNTEPSPELAAKQEQAQADCDTSTAG